MEKISIIIPVFNVKDYIEECLNSLINQTYRNVEILCIGELNHIDESYDIVKKYTKKYNNIKLLFTEKRFVGASRNYGLESATGDYILFMDSDDYLEKDAIESMYNNLIKYDSDMSCCGFSRIDYETKKIYSNEMINFKYDYLDINEKTINECAFISSCVWGKLMKASIAKKIKFVEDNIQGEDLIYMLELFPTIGKISFTKKIGYNYVVHAGSLTFSKSRDSIDKFMEEMLKVNEKYKNNYQNYESMLDLMVFIHIGIALPHRVSQTNSDSINKYIKRTKKYMDKYFYNWRKIKIKTRQNFSFKCFSIWVLKIMYKLNIFVLFILIYNFMIKFLKLDIKW